MQRAAVTGCNLNYFAGAEAVLRGVRRFHPDVARYCFVPPHEVAEAQQRFGDLARVLPPPRPLAGVPEAGHVQAHFARFFLPTVPADVAAWFDCDMVVCRPIDAVWEVAPGRVRAVRDQSWKIVFVLRDPDDIAAFSRAFPKHVDTHGFNAGMFALRPADWPALPELAEAGLAACGFRKFTGLFDQPFLNDLFLDHLDLLDFEYNVHGLSEHAIPAGARIVHYTGNPKPWMANFPKHEPAYYYWLRYGAGEERFWPLLKARARIWARTPRRLLSGFVAKRLRRD